MHIALIIFLVILGIPVAWFILGLTLIRFIRKIYPFPIPHFVVNLIDNPIRRKYIQNPDEIAERMGLKPGDIVLEVGPGKGSYTKAVAERVLPEGKVYAIDIQQPVLDRLEKRLKEENITNIIPKLDDAYNLSFDDDSIDIIFAIACLPEIPKQVEVLKEFKRVLKPGGIISLCELFIDPDYPLRRTEKKWAGNAGLSLKEEYGNWFAYQLNFTKE
ncbi:MAG: class I SAM-dependent methyltransferase [Candidatus Heimdallarchaeaceae archaeon]